MQQAGSGTEAPTPSTVVRRRIRELRQKQGMSAQKLADRCAELGMPELNRPVIANIETGRRPTVSIDEVLVLAYALNVAPIHLFVPVEPGAYMEVAPGFLLDAEKARTWVRGGRPLQNQDERRYDTEKPDEEWKPEPTDEELREQFRRMLDVIASITGDEDLTEIERRTQEVLRRSESVREDERLR